MCPLCWEDGMANYHHSYYDGLCDVTHASDWVTISNTYFHDHYKVSLVGHSDSNADEDTGHLTGTSQTLLCVVPLAHQ